MYIAFPIGGVARSFLMMAAWIRLCLAGLLFVVLLPPRAATTHDSPLLDALEEAAGDFLATYEGIAK